MIRSHSPVDLQASSHTTSTTVSSESACWAGTASGGARQVKVSERERERTERGERERKRERERKKERQGESESISVESYDTPNQQFQNVFTSGWSNHYLTIIC